MLRVLLSFFFSNTFNTRQLKNTKSSVIDLVLFRSELLFPHVCPTWRDRAECFNTKIDRQPFRLVFSQALAGWQAVI